MTCGIGFFSSVARKKNRSSHQVGPRGVDVEGEVLGPIIGLHMAEEAAMRLDSGSSLDLGDEKPSLE